MKKATVLKSKRWVNNLVYVNKVKLSSRVSKIDDSYMYSSPLQQQREKKILVLDKERDPILYITVFLSVMRD